MLVSDEPAFLSLIFDMLVLKWLANNIIILPYSPPALLYTYQQLSSSTSTTE